MTPQFADDVTTRRAAARGTATASPSARDLYFVLTNDPQGAVAAARVFLRGQIAAVRGIPADLPACVEEPPAWVQERNEAVGAAYRDYLAARKLGAPRRYFGSRAHALYFLQGVAPTKLVDGAWLYGLLRRWNNTDFRPLIRTYLEELGDGVPGQNHVALYRQLLAANGASGHADKALQALRLLLPRVGDRAAFLSRVLDGYRLNEPGASTASVIAEFDLEAELVRILAAKSALGKRLHSNYCRVAGRPVNDWLASPAHVPAFLAALESTGWINRGEEAGHSRFWHLVAGEHAGMFGVFTAYELEVLRDWIESAPTGALAVQRPRAPGCRARRRALDNLCHEEPRAPHQPERGLIRRHDHESEPGNELRLLEQRVAAASGKREAMAMLATLMAPGVHHSAAGLMATRLYSRLLDA